MLRRLRTGFVVLGCVLAGFLVSAGPGLVARAAEPQRWREHLLGSAGVVEQHRIAELEERLRQLEAERRATIATGSTRVASNEHEELLARNRELTRHNQALLLENQALSEARARASGACTPPEGEDAKMQLRYWAERLRSGDYGARGGLDPSQSAALTALLRPARALDRDNPWR